MELLGDCVSNERFGIPPSHPEDPKKAKAVNVLDEVYFESKKTGGSFEDSLLVTTRGGAFNRLSVVVGDGDGWSRLCFHPELKLDDGESALLCVRLVFKFSAPSLQKQKLFPILANTLLERRQHAELYKSSDPIRMASGTWYQLTGVFATSHQPESSKTTVILPLIANSRAEFAKIDIHTHPITAMAATKDRQPRIEAIKDFQLSALDTEDNYPVFSENHVFESQVDVSNDTLSGYILDSRGSDKILLKSIGDDGTGNLITQANHPVAAFEKYVLNSGFSFDLRQLRSPSNSCSLSAYLETNPDFETKFYFGKPVDSLAQLVDVDFITQQALRLKRLTEHNSLDFEEAITLLKQDDTLLIRPTPLFDPQFVASELALGDNLSTYEVLEAYVSDRRNWGIKTCALFSPDAFDPPSVAPLLSEYLRNPDYWHVSPHPLFDVDYFNKYAARLGAIETAPLSLYMKTAAKYNLSPSKSFDNYYYATQFEDVWDEKISALEHFVTTGLGEPKPGYYAYLRTLQSSRSAQLSAWEIFDKEKSGFLKHLNSYQANRNPSNDFSILVQMTPQRPRNPYYRQLPYLFSKQNIDFRYSVDVDDMIDFGSKKKSRLTLWFHQLEPFYHRSTKRETQQAMHELISKLKTLKNLGVNLVHTWHNALPHDPKYLDIDVKLYCEMDGIFDLIIAHSRKSIEWISKFCNSAPIKILPHPSLGHQLFYTKEKRLARQILKLPAEKFMFLSFGEIKPYKQIDLLVDAWKAYTHSRKAHNSFLMITGEWSKEVSTDCLSGARHLALHNRRVSDQELSLMIAAADACVITHQNIWVSGVAMAALRFGCPIILPDSAGLNDQFHEPENGFVFEASDVESLVSALGRAEQCSDMKSIITNNMVMNSQLRPEALSDKYVGALGPFLLKQSC